MQEIHFAHAACVDAALDRRAAHFNVCLRAVKLYTRCNADLPLYNVFAGDELRNRMLYLKARVHFHKIEILVAVHQKFHRTGVHIAHGFRRFRCRLKQLGALFLCHTGRGGFFNQLLVIALNGALTLAKAHHVPLLVTEQLHFYVFCRVNVFFHVHATVTERLLRFA